MSLLLMMMRTTAMRMMLTITIMTKMVMWVLIRMMLMVMFGALVVTMIMMTTTMMKIMMVGCGCGGDDDNTGCGYEDAVLFHTSSALICPCTDLYYCVHLLYLLSRDTTEDVNVVMWNGYPWYGELWNAKPPNVRGGFSQPLNRLVLPQNR